MFTGQKLFQLTGSKIPESWKVSNEKKHAPKKEEPKKAKARKTPATVAKKRRRNSSNRSGDESVEDENLNTRVRKYKTFSLHLAYFF